MLVCLIEATPLKNGVPTTVHMCSASCGSAVIHQDNKEWFPVITVVPEPNWAVNDENGAIGEFNITDGKVSFRVGKSFGNQEWVTYDWNGATATGWIGSSNQPRSSYTRFFTGRVSDLTRTGTVAELALRSLEAQLDVPLLSAHYSGTGAQEGSEDDQGALKPRSHGWTPNVTPYKVSDTYEVYQVHGYGRVESILAVYEYAQSLDSYKGDVATWDDLVGYPLVPGEWITCLALGMFRLGGKPEKKITADVLGGVVGDKAPHTVAGIIRQLLKEAGVSDERIGDLSVFDSFEWSLYQTQQTAIAETIRKAAADAGGWVFLDRFGIWQGGRWPDNRKAPLPLRPDRTSEPLVQTISKLAGPDPIWKVDIGHTRNWTVMAEGDFSPKLKELEGKLVARDELVEELKDQAEQAAADALFARREVDAMLTDGLIDRAEKRRVIDDLEITRVQHSQLAGVYLAYGVQDQWTAYDAAQSALDAFMTGLSPSIFDSEVSTPVDRQTYSAVWLAYHANYVAILNSIARTAEWKDVSGPGKPQDNATVGAPKGTDVAGVPAEQLVDMINNVAGVDLYPVIEMVQEVAALGRRTLNANDKAAAAFRDEAIGHVEELRADVLVGETNWQQSNDALTTKTRELQTAISDQKTVLSNEIKAVSDTVSIVAAKAASNEAAHLLEKSATATLFEAQATKLEEMEAEVAGAHAGISAAREVSAQALKAETSAREQQISNLNGSLTAAIQRESQTRTDGVTALSNDIRQVSAETARANGRITNAERAIVDGDKANASAIQTVQANLNGTNNALALVQQSASASSDRLGNVEAQASLSVQAGGTIAGWKAIANGSGTSQLVFEGGAIAFRNPANGQNSNLMVFENGALRLNTAYIGHATINSAHIQNLTIGTDKIAVNAVTVTHYAERGQIMYGNGGQQTSLSYSLYAPTDCELIVIVKGNQAFPSGDRAWGGWIYCDGNALDSAGGAKTADTYTLIGKMRVGAGNHTITTGWRGENSNVRLNGQRMIILEARR